MGIIANALQGLGRGIQNLPNTLGANLYPVDPAMGLDPQAVEAQRRAALIRAGLGFSGASQTGAGFGQAALAGINAGQGPLDTGLAASLRAQAVAQEQERRARMDTLEEKFRNWQMEDKPVAAKPETPEVFGAPQQMVYQGKPAMVQVGNRGTVRPIEGAAPYQAPKDAAGASGTKTGLEPDAIRDAVVDVLSDPTKIRNYASFGQSGQDIRNQINNEKSKYLKSIGLTEQEVVRQQAIAKGQVKSVSDLVGMQNAVQAYETVARGNGERVLELVKKVNTTGVPAGNTLSRIVQQHGAGSADAAELMQVLQNYQTEVARIIANPRLVGQLTDTAREEITRAVPANMTPAQAERIISRLNFEFELRNRGISDSIAQAQGQMTPGFQAPPAASATAPPAAIPPPQAIAQLKEGVHTKFGNGQTWTLQGGKPVQVQ